MYDDYSQNTCSGDSDVVILKMVLMVMVVKCDGEVPMN